MTQVRSSDIAVTGISARFPGPSRLDEWWRAVKAGRVLTTRYETRELLDVGVPAQMLEDPDYMPVHGHLSDAARFDNELFRVSPREAEMTDPQHRLMLETTWAALENAGEAPLREAATTAVYASAAPSGYMRRMLARGPLDPLTLEDALHGTEPDFMASRIAYKLGFTGPAVGVQCACSSSLVAVHMAARSLLDGDCDQAVVVAAGVSFPQAGYLHMPGGIFSASGSCRPFDADADGTVAGSGVACVVLRRLADVPADGPEPRGVILGTAINNDGTAKAGYYAPSIAGQEAVIRAALRAAGVDASSIGFLEAHGTGTLVGDPIEWAAASSALAASGAGPGQVAVGAVKANIGHLDAAAGLASLVKALLVVEEGTLPPIAGLARPNPLLETDGSPLFIPEAAMPWAGALPRRAGVSSFGIGGTNAHVVIEQAPAPAARKRPQSPRSSLLLVSCGGPGALSRSAAQLSHDLAEHEPHLADVSYSLATGRAELPERLAVTGRTGSEVAERLANGSRVVRARAQEVPGPPVFLFPGQGSQYPGMAIPFGDAMPGFSAALEQCLDGFDVALASLLRDALWDEAFPAEELDATELAQPALFALEYAAAATLAGLGVRPAAVAGHSLGEITAACVAGALDLRDAARFVVARGRAMQACPEGAMLALGCEEAHARELVADFGEALELAAVNRPESCVVSGPPAAVDAFESWLGERVFSKRLRTARAFHSALIEPALPELAGEVANLTLRSPAIPLGLNASGRLAPPGAAIAPGAFIEQARSTVRFAEMMASIAARFGQAVLVEVGPGGTLSAMVDDLGLVAVALCPVRATHAGEKVQLALGELWAIGQPIVPVTVCGEGRRIRLAGYPFHGPEWIAAEAMDAPPPAMAPAEGSSVAGQDRADPPVNGHEPRPDPGGVMVALWKELLGYAELTEESDFFDLGGDSLLVTHLVHRIDQELGVRVPVREMMSGRTLGRQTTVVVEQLGGRT